VSRSGRWRALLGPGLMTLVMLAVLIGLGVWQVERLAWKTALLDTIDRAEAAPPTPLPPHPAAFEKVRAQGRFRADLRALYGADVRDTAEGPQMGAGLLVPLERSDGPPILVDRGWVPLSRRQAIAIPQGEVSVEGYVRPEVQPGLFSATDDLVRRHFYTLDPAAIGPALGIANLAPFTLIAMGSPPPGQFPIPARHLPRPPNNHLSYAITWFGLAGALLVVFVVWANRVIRA
jgi:surfeit locus 1 family protein